jgi:hypothetical protein
MTGPAAPSHGAGTSPMSSTAPRRRAPTDERRSRFPWRQQQRHLGGVSQAEPLSGTSQVMSVTTARASRKTRPVNNPAEGRQTGHREKRFGGAQADSIASAAAWRSRRPTATGTPPCRMTMRRTSRRHRLRCFLSSALCG